MAGSFELDVNHKLWVACKCDRVDMVDFYISLHGDMNYRESGLTCLGIAVLKNKLMAVRLLLNAGADAKFQDQYGMTALHTAAYSCQTPDIITALLIHGADPSIEAIFAYTPGQISKMSGKNEIYISGVTSWKNTIQNQLQNDDTSLLSWLPSDIFQIIWDFIE